MLTDYQLQCLADLIEIRYRRLFPDRWAHSAIPSPAECIDAAAIADGAICQPTAHNFQLLPKEPIP